MILESKKSMNLGPAIRFTQKIKITIELKLASVFREFTWGALRFYLMHVPRTVLTFLGKDNIFTRSYIPYHSWW